LLHVRPNAPHLRALPTGEIGIGKVEQRKIPHRFRLELLAPPFVSRQKVEEGGRRMYK